MKSINKYACTPDKVSGNLRQAVGGFYLPFYFDILNDGLCLYSLWSYVGHSACPLSLGPQRKVFVCVVMLLYSQAESLHNTAEVVGMRVGLIGTKRGFILVFTLCKRHNCVIKKTGFFFNILGNCVLISPRCALSLHVL